MTRSRSEPRVRPIEESGFLFCVLPLLAANRKSLQLWLDEPPFPVLQRSSVHKKARAGSRFALAPLFARLRLEMLAPNRKQQRRTTQKKSGRQQGLPA